ncbi:hypothetical protein [Herbaspirillum sp. RV1423]|uniref:hypothetical protein n=1 Tax=Herbaspirillum sp. RV1423 TaxID=1443993 RepID=UPI0004AF3434|nr:hypothetical protein [Herbaspirillum sp. RV1423]
MSTIYKQTGGIALPMLALIVALLGAFTSIAALARYEGVQTQLHQAQQQAVLAVAKEGRGGKNNNEAALQALAQAYLRVNLDALDKTGNISDATLVSVDADHEQMTVRYPMTPWFNHTDDTGKKLLSVSSQVRAERFFRKTETVVVLGAGAMGGAAFGSTFVKEARRGVSNYVRQMFRDQIQARDAWISLVSYGELVNIGWDYKDKLITPISRRIPPVLETVAREFNWWQDQDMLSINGVAGRRRAVCAQRLPYTGQLQDIETAPVSADSGFHVDLQYGTREVILNGRKYENELARWAGFAGGYLGISAEAFGLQKPAADTNLKRAVAAGQCAMMPMLVASTNAEQLAERLTMYQTIAYGAPDQGLAWALRALSPKWRSIWERGAVPHDYGPDVDKKIVLLLTSGMTATPVAELGLLGLLCDRIRQRGIEVTALFNGDKGLANSYWTGGVGTGNITRQAIARCTPTQDPEIGRNPNMKVFSLNDRGNLSEVFDRLGRRVYRVRLIE